MLRATPMSRETPKTPITPKTPKTPRISEYSAVRLASLLKQANALRETTDVSSFSNPPTPSHLFNTEIHLLSIEGDRAANHLIPNLGSAPQPLQFPRFPGPQAPQNRNTPLGSGRLQNTKIGLHMFCYNIA